MHGIRRMTPLAVAALLLSGGGYTVMQLLVTDVAGKPFAQYMSETVLGPIVMSSSTYEQPLPANRASQTASGHYADRSEKNHANDQA